MKTNHFAKNTLIFFASMFAIDIIIAGAIAIICGINFYSITQHPLFIVFVMGMIAPITSWGIIDNNNN